jgi:HEPN domain-containing protein
MSADLHIANSLRLAHEDLVAARALSAIDNRNDVYHLQQAAEKILLALLNSENIRAERRDSHRLDVLHDLLPNQNAFKVRLSAITFLTVYATTYRYPKDAGRLPQRGEKDQIEAAADTLEVILADAAKHFGVGLTDSDREAAQRTTPPRV